MAFHSAQGDTSPYVCAQCGEPVILVAGMVYKPCGHTDAAVIADVAEIAAQVPV